MKMSKQKRTFVNKWQNDVNGFARSSDKVILLQRFN